jgi:CRP-like cAMP-binding protein
MQNLLSHISPLFSFSNEKAKAALEEMLVEKHFSKNDLLIEEGQVCRHLYFLEKGAVRGFYNIDGKDISQWFGFENDFVTSFRSFISRSAAREYIQVVEDSVLWSISKENLEALLFKFPELEKLLMLI